MVAELLQAAHDGDCLCAAFGDFRRFHSGAGIECRVRRGRGDRHDGVPGFTGDALRDSIGDTAVGSVGVPGSSGVLVRGRIRTADVRRYRRTCRANVGRFNRFPFGFCRHGRTVSAGGRPAGSATQHPSAGVRAGRVFTRGRGATTKEHAGRRERSTGRVPGRWPAPRCSAPARNRTECTGNVSLRIYSGRTKVDGSPNQNDPFGLLADANEPFELQANPADLDGPIGGWGRMTVLPVGDQNNDKIMDIVARDKLNNELRLYRGKMANGVYSLDRGTDGQGDLYGASGWGDDTRPLLATSGNAQVTVVDKTVTDDDNTKLPYKEFQIKAGEEPGNLWATTPNDPDKNYTVRYVDSAGNPQTSGNGSGVLELGPRFQHHLHQAGDEALPRRLALVFCWRAPL